MAGGTVASLTAAEIARQMQVRVPNPGTVADRHVMAASQPGFLGACRAGVNAARAATCADGHGNSTHPAVQHWGRFTIIGLQVRMQRPLDPMITPLERKLEEVALVDAFAWWLVTQVGVNTETAWSYVCTVNAWHERNCGVGLAVQTQRYCAIVSVTCVTSVSVRVCVSRASSCALYSNIATFAYRIRELPHSSTLQRL